MLSFSNLKFFVVLFFTGLLSCNSSNSKKVYGDNILHIELCPHKININYLYASELVSNIEYIPLETSDQCLINGHPEVDMSDNYIITSGDQHCFLFSRQGKFIRQIGSKGQGPGEYTGGIRMVTIDEKSGMIYIASIYELLAFRISGEFVKKLNLWEFVKSNKISTYPPKNITYWKDDMFFANIDLNTGNEPYRFVVFSIDGNVVKLFPNDIKFEVEGGVFLKNGINDCADIYFYNGQLRFRGQASDTLFCLTDHLELVPEIIFDLCGRNIPTNMRGNNNFFTNKKSYTLIGSIVEMRNQIFLSCDFGDKTPPGLLSSQELWYDKNSNKLTILKQDFLGQKRRKIPVANTSGVFINKNVDEQLIDIYRQGIINDIDGGYDFFPYRKIIHNQNNQQLLCAVYLPFRILEDMTEEHFASKEIKNKEANVRLRNLLKNLKEDDNPVLMIVTFK